MKVVVASQTKAGSLIAGTVDSDGIRHSAKVAWRALANLQKEIERKIERDQGVPGL